VVAVADREIRPEEEALLSRLAREFDIDERQASRLLEELSATSGNEG
jgi:hypothetical protein